MATRTRTLEFERAKELDTQRGVIGLAGLVHVLEDIRLDRCRFRVLSDPANDLYSHPFLSLGVAAFENAAKGSHSDFLHDFV